MSYAKEVDAKFLNGKDYPLKPTDMSNVALRLETTNICNHACEFCPNRKLQRKRKFIESDLARRVIKEAAEMGIRRGGFFIMGEPLLNEETLDFYAYAKELGFETLFLTSNGSLADEKTIKRIFESGVTSLKFSINAGSRETYKKVHGKDNYEEAMHALRYAYKYRNAHNIDCRILSSYIVTKDNVDEIRQHYKNIREYVDDFAFFGMATFASTVLEDTENIKTEFDSQNVPHVDFANTCPCALIVNSVNVTCEGFLHLCVTDPMNLAAIHDLHNMSLKEAWYSERMVEIRRMHAEGHIEGTVCDNCINRLTNPVLPFNEELYRSSLVEGDQL